MMRVVGIVGVEVGEALGQVVGRRVRQARASVAEKLISEVSGSQTGSTISFDNS